MTSIDGKFDEPNISKSIGDWSKLFIFLYLYHHTIENSKFAQFGENEN